MKAHVLKTQQNGMSICNKLNPKRYFCTSFIFFLLRILYYFYVVVVTFILYFYYLRSIRTQIYYERSCKNVYKMK